MKKGEIVVVKTGMQFIIGKLYKVDERSLVLLDPRDIIVREDKPMLMRSASFFSKFDLETLTVYNYDYITPPNEGILAMYEQFVK
jgi:hypothetical protein